MAPRATTSAALLRDYTRKTVVPFVLLAAAGILFSWVLFGWTVADSLGACISPARDAEGVISVWGTIVNCTAGAVFSLFYLLVGPFVYFQLALRFGINNGLNYLLTHAQHRLWAFLMRRLLNLTRKEHGDVTPANVLKVAKRFARQLPTLPWLLRAIVRIILSRVDFYNLLRENLDAWPAGTPIEAEALAYEVGGEFSEQLTGWVVEPSWIGLGILTALEIGGVVFIKAL